MRRCLKNTRRTEVKQLERRLVRVKDSAGTAFKMMANFPGTDKQMRAYATRLSIAAIDDRDLELVRRMTHSDLGYDITGHCEICSINLTNPDGRPNEKAMPCNLPDCPYE